MCTCTSYAGTLPEYTNETSAVVSFDLLPSAGTVAVVATLTNAAGLVGYSMAFAKLSTAPECLALSCIGTDKANDTFPDGQFLAMVSGYNVKPLQYQFGTYDYATQSMTPVRCASTTLLTRLARYL